MGQRYTKNDEATPLFWEGILKFSNEDPIRKIFEVECFTINDVDKNSLLYKCLYKGNKGDRYISQRVSRKRFFKEQSFRKKIFEELNHYIKMDDKFFSKGINI